MKSDSVTYQVFLWLLNFQDSTCSIDSGCRQLVLWWAGCGALEVCSLQCGDRPFLALWHPTLALVLEPGVAGHTHHSFAAPDPSTGFAAVQTQRSATCYPLVTPCLQVCVCVLGGMDVVLIQCVRLMQELVRNCIVDVFNIIWRKIHELLYEIIGLVMVYFCPFYASFVIFNIVYTSTLGLTHSTSCLGHKEFRFLLPVLPLCLCVASDHIAFHLAAHAKRSGHPMGFRYEVTAWLRQVLRNFHIVLVFKDSWFGVSS